GGRAAGHFAARSGSVMGLRPRLAFRQAAARGLAKSLVSLVPVFFQNSCARRPPITHGKGEEYTKGPSRERTRPVHNLFADRRPRSALGLPRRNLRRRC